MKNKRRSGGGNEVAAQKRAEWAKKHLTKPDSEVFCENATIGRHHVKKKIIQRNLIPYECAVCGNQGEWLGKPLSLVLDHINGINNDNRLENLRFVCSNCDSQLPTYKNRRGKGVGEEIKKLREEGKTYEEIKEILECSVSTVSYHLNK
tara:strand:- start:38 stop:484 length:447 start_codon:yes stop_codon:yes gene_type:complete